MKLSGNNDLNSKSFPGRHKSGNLNLACKKIPIIHLHFSHLFNAYTKYFNKRFNRNGKLFERSFKRKLIHDKVYLKQILIYIHNNPVHHRFCEHALGYPWSSYLAYIFPVNKHSEKDAVVGWFDDEANFRLMHDQKLNIKPIEEWLEME